MSQTLEQNEVHVDNETRNDSEERLSKLENLLSVFLDNSFQSNTEKRLSELEEQNKSVLRELFTLKKLVEGCKSDITEVYEKIVNCKGLCKINCDAVEAQQNDLSAIQKRLDICECKLSGQGWESSVARRNR